MSNLKFWPLLKETAKAGRQDQVATLGAALSYYAVFSLAPLLIILIAAAGYVFGEQASRGQIFEALRGTVGPQAAQAVQTLIQGVHHAGSGLIATAVGLITLLLGALGLFTQLQSSLDFIWHVPSENVAGWKGSVRRRALVFALLVAVAMLMLASLALTALLGALAHFVTQSLPGGETVWLGVQFAVTLALQSVLFALIFKILPNTRIRWRDVWSGAIFTSLLFTLGKTALGIYLSKSGFSSAYGAAGSLLVLLVWIYYSSQIFFFGAEFTKVCAHASGIATVHPFEKGTPSKQSG